MDTYCTNEGPERGPFLYRDAQDSAISVMEWPGAYQPVGRALPTSWAHDGLVQCHMRPPVQAYLVVVMDTQYYSGQYHTYEDYAIS